MALALTLNAWSKGEFGWFWVWMGSSGATAWLAILAMGVIAVRVGMGLRAASSEKSTKGVEHLLRRAGSTLLAGSIAVAISDPLVSRVIKPMIASPRPCQIGVTDVPSPLVCGSGFAMPSAHASNAAAVAGALMSPPLAVVAAVVGVGRVVDGLHWPGDVVAGWVLGGAIGVMVRRRTDDLFKTA